MNARVRSGLSPASPCFRRGLVKRRGFESKSTDSGNRCALLLQPGCVPLGSKQGRPNTPRAYLRGCPPCIVAPPLPYLVQIKFFKSTMFRKTIESKSLSETRQVWESFISMTKDAIEKRRPGEASALPHVIRRFVNQETRWWHDSSERDAFEVSSHQLVRVCIPGKIFLRRVWFTVNLPAF